MTLVLDGTSGVTFPNNSAQSVAAADGLGVGQTYQDMSGSRAANTTYTNTTGKPILIYEALITGTNAIGILTYSFSVNGSVVQSGTTGNGTVAFTRYGSASNIVIPPGATYQLTFSNAVTTTKWVELR